MIVMGWWSDLILEVSSKHSNSVKTQSKLTLPQPQLITELG